MQQPQIIYVAVMPEVAGEDITGYGSTREEAVHQVKSGYLKIKPTLSDGLPWKQAIDYHGLSVTTVAISSVHLTSGRVLHNGDWIWAEVEDLAS
jgi:hypothetical protein